MKDVIKEQRVDDKKEQKKYSGPSTEPCGTPAQTGNGSEEGDFSLMCRVWPDLYELNQ